MYMYIYMTIYMYLQKVFLHRIGSEHNTMVTQRIVNDVANLGEFMDRREIEC